MSKSKLSLRIFADQIARIMTQEPDGKTTIYCPCDGVEAKVEMGPRMSNPNDRQWDYVTLNDAYVGNRWGAIQEFTRMVIEENPEVVLEEK